jgi:hypothetical protein
MSCAVRSVARFAATTDQAARFAAWVRVHGRAWEHVCAAARRGQDPAAAWAEVWEAAMAGRYVLAWMEPASLAIN